MFNAAYTQCGAAVAAALEDGKWRESGDFPLKYHNPSPEFRVPSELSA